MFLCPYEHIYRDSHDERGVAAAVAVCVAVAACCCVWWCVRRALPPRTSHVHILLQPQPDARRRRVTCVCGSGGLSALLSPSVREATFFILLLCSLFPIVFLCLVFYIFPPLLVPPYIFLIYVLWHELFLTLLLYLIIFICG